MSRSPGCQASPLINAIFYRLPYFTSGLTTNVSVENILDDFVVRNLDVTLVISTKHTRHTCAIKMRVVTICLSTASGWMGCYHSWHSDCAQYLHLFLLLLHEFPLLRERQGEAAGAQAALGCHHWCHYHHWNVSALTLLSSDEEKLHTCTFGGVCYNYFDVTWNSKQNYG